MKAPRLRGPGPMPDTPMDNGRYTSNGQGAENYAIKSGTNKFHGSLFEYFRNTKLDTRSFFASKRPKENQNESGGTVGGPIIRNKLFFFGTYDAWRCRVETSPAFVTVPTLRMPQGDFSELPAPIFDLATTEALTGGGFTHVRHFRETLFRRIASRRY